MPFLYGPQPPLEEVVQDYFDERAPDIDSRAPRFTVGNHIGRVSIRVFTLPQGRKLARSSQRETVFASLFSAPGDVQPCLAVGRHVSSETGDDVPLRVRRSYFIGGAIFDNSKQEWEEAGQYDQSALWGVVWLPEMNHLLGQLTEPTAHDPRTDPEAWRHLERIMQNSHTNLVEPLFSRAAEQILSQPPN